MISNEGKVLGKQVDYPKSYSPEILVAVPRYLNRAQYNIEEDNLPFIGYDVWHAYEFSFLTKKGLPVTGLLKLVYPSDSPSIVESKSLKLYLNSYNMERLGDNVEEGVQIAQQRIQEDLTHLLETEVELNLITKSINPNNDFKSYSVLEESEDLENVEFKAYNEAPELLKGEKSELNRIKIASHLLRSNCKVTHQPDWGSIFIDIESNYEIDKIALLQYLVSFRNENHFHEEICEMAYKRLWDTFAPSQLAVTCIYTRRGGIDICPVRVSQASLLPIYLVNEKVLSEKLLRQ